MNEKQRDYFRNKLLMWKEDILHQTRETLNGLHNEISIILTSPTGRRRRPTALELRARDRQRKLTAKLTPLSPGSTTVPTATARRPANRSRSSD